MAERVMRQAVVGDEVGQAGGGSVQDNIQHAKKGTNHEDIQELSDFNTPIFQYSPCAQHCASDGL